MNISGQKEYFEVPKRDKRFTNPGIRKTFEVSHMWEIHQEITRLIFLGMKNVDIAERLGVTKDMVSYTRNSKIVQDKLKLMHGAKDANTVDLAKKIKEFAPRALKLLEEVVEGTGLGAAASPALRVKTAENWVDRAGYPAQKAGQGGLHLHAHFTANEISEIRKRAEESGIVIDIEKEDKE